MTCNQQNISPNAGAVIATSLMNVMARQLPSAQEKRGDDKLERARALTAEFSSVIAEEDRNTIEDRVAQ